MIDQREFDLLSDLARLLKKYGPGAFKELARILREPEVIKNLIEIVEASASAGQSLSAKKIKKDHSQAHRTGTRQLLADLAEKEPLKAELLSKFNDALTTRIAYPSLKDLRAFVMDNGLESIRTNTRDKAIYQVLKDLAARPVEAIKSIISRARIEAKADDRSLEGWAEVILDKKKRQPKKMS
jgi:hypothetical protein